jgi:uncharacterized protein YbjT (DUF2867 family)
MTSDKVLILGATGYIGSRLTQTLLDKGYHVRAATRSLKNVKVFPWGEHPRLEWVEADALDHQGLLKACQGCQVVYYLVHSMNPAQKDFEEADRLAAKNMVMAAQKAQVKRIIYLGGLGEEEKGLSKHLRSRMEVLKVLHSGSVPVTTLRAAMIIGKGSVSFEILRALVKRLPVMITPRWVSTQSQPIAIHNVIHYLVGCLEQDQTIGQVFDMGGPDIVSYRQLMDIYAEETGLKKRWIIPVPVLTPRLSSLWIGLVTPYPSYIARPLAEGLRNRVVCRDNRIRELIPQKLIPCREAVKMALQENAL